MTTTHRRSIEIEGLSHLTAIPVATRIGPLLVTSVIMPFDPGTRTIPDDPVDQLANIFTHAGRVLAAADATWDDVAKMDIWVPDISVRGEIDRFWTRHFPDPLSRPSRHTQISGPSVSATLLAYIGGDRDAHR